MGDAFAEKVRRLHDFLGDPDNEQSFEEFIREECPFFIWFARKTTAFRPWMDSAVWIYQEATLLEIILKRACYF